MQGNQIFQTKSPSRWKKFKWLSRVIVLAVFVALTCAGLTIFSNQYPKLPDLSHVPSYSKKQLDQIKRSAKYKEFKFEKAKLISLEKDKLKHQRRHPDLRNRINAGFFVDWDPQSYTSLHDHINQMDMVIPEVFFLKPGTDSLKVKIDPEVVNLVKSHHKKLIASLKNITDDGNWNGQEVHYIISSPQRTDEFINNLLIQLRKYKIDGVNVDFEEMIENSDEPIIAFQKKLYESLHAHGYLVTQDVMPDNDDYNIDALNNYNDYIFLMAYDQHTELSDAGDISHQKWVEEQLDDICKKIPSEKVILAIAGYGFDWPENSVGTSVTYQKAISLAQQHNSKVVFDSNSGNLHFGYSDNRGTKHTVYFTDAATNFNTIRLADDWGAGGVALWRLGSEDSRLWTFFDKDLSLESLKKNGFNKDLLTRFTLNNRVDYSGDGEILDLVSAPKNGRLALTLDPKTMMVTDQQYVTLPTKYTINKFGEADKKVILTFDDGPDPTYTPQILDILKKEKVPATFFMVGMMAEQNIPLVKEIYNRGYEIGNHTFFHPDLSKVSNTRVQFELNATRKLIECITGRSTILFRPPYNADAEPQTEAEILPVLQSKKENYINVGESIDPQDWYPGISADSIVARVIAQHNNGSMILLHDAGGDRTATIAALPRIIHYFKSQGYQFTTVVNILGKSKDAVMPPITDDADSGFMGNANRLFVEALFYGNKFLYYIFTTAILLALGRISVIIFLARKAYKQEKANELLVYQPLPQVSIIIPAYNEEITAVNTIDSLLKLNYSSYELIFVDDGSKDETFNIVSRTFANNSKVRVFTKPNGGKASALNYGIELANYPFVVCIDADTQLHPDSVMHMMNCFANKDVAAVAGTVKVGNETNYLTKWQSIEYITSQNMDRRAFDLINSITVVPGAIGAFRKDVIQQVGGFTSDTLAEDCDLTMRILKAGHIVKNCSKAVAYTEAPETLNMFLKQRFRWSFGVMQSFWKNRHALFNKKYRYFGMVGMPNILIFQIILPLFAPLADLFMLIALLSGFATLIHAGSMSWTAIATVFSPTTSFGQVIIYYFLFVLVDMAFAMYAFKLEGERYKKLIYMIPQRLIWRQLMYYVLFKSVRKAIKGEINGWGVLKRTGNVQINPIQSTLQDAV
ncbi:glycosyltransferase [Pedobacter sp. HMF7647]|uniref:Glycosyltransferase n=1 Tax=Hufsiella arboris TaxID=2695275 RepID=A0A7K1YAR4_9SPHI|nr:glycosyltransferase [Hufsiella arboris]MXV51664.1 glycosyltransferase [Hufsiella arboris]